MTTQIPGDGATHTSTSSAQRPSPQPAHVFSDDQEVRAVSVTELSRAVSATVEQAISGDRVIITRHGAPVAMIVSIADALEGLIAGSESFALLRREAREQLERGEAVPLPPWRSAPE